MKKDIIAKLKVLANKHSARGNFNRAVSAMCEKRLGVGAFRAGFAYDANTVIKVRRATARIDSGFTMQDIEGSNSDEVENYDALVSDFPILSHFILKPTFVALPNDHDAVLMLRAEGTIDSLGGAAFYHRIESTPFLADQLSVIESCFSDAHWGNIGVIGNRLYVIDLNRPCYTDEVDCCRSLIDSLIVKFNDKQQSAEACA